MRIWTLGSLVHQINSFSEVLKLKQVFQKNKVVPGKTPLFVIGPFVLTLASDRAVLNGNDVFSNLVVSSKKRYSSFLKKSFRFPENLFQS